MRKLCTTGSCVGMLVAIEARYERFPRRRRRALALFQRFQRSPASPSSLRLSSRFRARRKLNYVYDSRRTLTEPRGARSANVNEGKAGLRASARGTGNSGRISFGKKRLPRTLMMFTAKTGPICWRLLLSRTNDDFTRARNCRADYSTNCHFCDGRNRPYR